jgi:hypothetical protein
VESLLQAADSGHSLLDGSPLSSIAEQVPALRAGEKLGNFEIVAMIGRGGMGEVYRARDVRLKRDVAIKTLPSGLAFDRDRIARFEREARTASPPNHPNIVSVYEIGTDSGVSFIVSELVDGETLARIIERGPLPLRKLIEAPYHATSQSRRTIQARRCAMDLRRRTRQASPLALERIVRRCIEKEPERRFQSAADLGFALHSLHIASSPQPGLRREPLRRAWGKLAWAAFGAVVLLAAGARWMTFRPAGPAAPPELTLRRLTSDERLSFAPAISPDGKLVAYTSNRADPDHFDIWVQPIDGGGAIRLTDDPANHWSPTFLPDGSQIGFRSDRDKGGIYLVPTLGGEARELVPQGKAPRFSPYGQWLIYSTGQEIQINGELFIQALSGGPPAQIGKGTMVCHQAVWSPDGRRILFWADCNADPNEGIEPRGQASGFTTSKESH